MSKSLGQLSIDVALTEEERRQALLDDVRAGLTSRPKRISPVWFYDDRGSGLFDAITRLPEYYLTRAERGLLTRHAGDIAGRAQADTLVELGSGTSEKTRLLLDAMSAAGTLARYVPLDVSEETLRRASHVLAQEFPALEVHGIVGDFHRHLERMPRRGRRLVAFLGSTIGNLTPAERARFLFDLDANLDHDDWLLLGVDLVKDPERLVAAYDDPGGVTAEFNRNALRVLNAELGADFDPERFSHIALWNDRNAWIEMRLRAEEAHQVRVPAAGIVIDFEEGEELRTEISSKFTVTGIEEELATAGFVTEERWHAQGDFLLVLARPYC